MLGRTSWGLGATILVVATGCAEGTVDDYELENGIYELATTRVEGDCVVDGAITGGSEFEGKVARVLVDASASRLKLEACDEFFEDDCRPEPFTEPMTMLRDTSDLRANDEAWEVPDCTCTVAYRGQRQVDGAIVADGRAELTWELDLPASPSSCTCEVAACTLTVEQTLVAAGETL
jgi:hypothetical protein